MSLSAFHPLLYLDPLPLPLRYAVDFNTQKNTFTFGGILDTLILFYKERLKILYSWGILNAV